MKTQLFSTDSSFNPVKRELLTIKPVISDEELRLRAFNYIKSIASFYSQEELNQIVNIQYATGEGYLFDLNKMQIITEICHILRKNKPFNELLKILEKISKEGSRKAFWRTPFSEKMKGQHDLEYVNSKESPEDAVSYGSCVDNKCEGTTFREFNVQRARPDEPAFYYKYCYTCKRTFRIE